MKIATWSIINNEIDFLPSIIPFHLQFVDLMYFLDTGSTDGGLQFLENYAKNDSRVIVEKYHESYVPDYSVEWREMSNPFPEVEVRNYALTQAEKLNPNAWLVQLDGDEIFLPKVREVIEKSHKSIISHSTINPVEELNKHPIEMRAGVKLHDPHSRIWKANAGVKYAQNPMMHGKQFHSIPTQNDKHVYHSKENEFVPDVFHFHLHWMYGSKLERFHNKLGISDKKEMLVKQKINMYGGLVPKEFWNKRKEWLKE